MARSSLAFGLLAWSLIAAPVVSFAQTNSLAQTKSSVVWRSPNLPAPNRPAMHSSRTAAHSTNSQSTTAGVRQQSPATQQAHRVVQPLRWRKPQLPAAAVAPAVQGTAAQVAQPKSSPIGLAQPTSLAIPQVDRRQTRGKSASNQTGQQTAAKFSLASYVNSPAANQPTSAQPGQHDARQRLGSIQLTGATSTATHSTLPTAQTLPTTQTSSVHRAARAHQAAAAAPKFPTNPFRRPFSSVAFQSPVPPSTSAATATRPAEPTPAIMLTQARQATPPMTPMESAIPAVAAPAVEQSSAQLPAPVAQPQTAGRSAAVATPGQAGVTPAASQAAAGQAAAGQPLAQPGGRLIQPVIKGPPEYNFRDCAKERERCENTRQLLKNQSIRNISLNISPSILPSAKTPEEVEQEKQRRLGSLAQRDWLDRRGEVIARGQLVDFKYQQIEIVDAAGEPQRIRVSQLSDDDMCYVAAWWGIPTECTLAWDDYVPRPVVPITFAWKASALCNKPLYFEDLQLERYGHTRHPVVQPFVSGGHFVLSLAALPYQMGINPPNECQYPLGQYRPGNCAPWLMDPIPLSLRGALFEAGAVVGGIGIFP